MNKKKVYKVYLVTTGAYEFNVIAPFDSIEAAEEFMRLVPGQYNEIQTYKVNPETTMLIKNGYSMCDVIMLKDGTVESVYWREPSPGDSVTVACENIHYLWERTKAPAYRDDPEIQDVIKSRVWAKNKKHAIRIVEKQRAAMVAAGEWK